MGEAALKLEWEERKTCQYKTHEHCGQEVEYCEKHGQKACGPFGHYCLECQPFMALACRICRAPRYLCCC